MSELVRLLHEGRRRERSQALFYRLLAGDAEIAGDEVAAERLNELLADEQHHVSRLTARLLELGQRPDDGVDTPEVPPLSGWETVARRREEDEVRWYEDAVRAVQDEPTVEVMKEILASEIHHRDNLEGKWMPAARPRS